MDGWAFLGNNIQFVYNNDECAPEEICGVGWGGEWTVTYDDVTDGHIILCGEKYQGIQCNPSQNSLICIKSDGQVDNYAIEIKKQ